MVRVKSVSSFTEPFPQGKTKAQVLSSTVEIRTKVTTLQFPSLGERNILEENKGRSRKMKEARNISEIFLNLKLSWPAWKSLPSKWPLRSVTLHLSPLFDQANEAVIDRPATPLSFAYPEIRFHLTFRTVHEILRELFVQSNGLHIPLGLRKRRRRSKKRQIVAITNK